MLADLNDLRKQVFEYLQEQDIDLIICPGFAIPAFKLGLSNVLNSFTLANRILYYVHDDLEYSQLSSWIHACHHSST